MSNFLILTVIILSVGALQGIVYGIILFNSKKENILSNRFLSLILFFFSYNIIVQILKTFGLGNYDIWYHILLDYSWIYGSLLFLFTCSYANPNFRFNKKDLIHFIPFLIEFMWENFIKSQNFYWDGTKESLSWLGYQGFVVWNQYPIMYPIAELLVIFYGIKSIKVINKATVEQNLITPDGFQWIKKFIISLSIISVLSFVFAMIDFFIFEYQYGYYYHLPMFILLALLTYFLGIVGFSKRNEKLFRPQTKLSESERVILHKIKKNLFDLMELEKVFKDQKLTLTTLANKLNTKPYLLTKCLSEIIGKKFNDYINELRIKEWQLLIKEPNNKNYTILGLAFESGFNSKASFNRAVKKHLGKSPSEIKMED